MTSHETRVGVRDEVPLDGFDEGLANISAGFGQSDSFSHWHCRAGGRTAEAAPKHGQAEPYCGEVLAAFGRRPV